MRTIVPGGIAGTGLSVLLLRYLLPELLGRQYLNGYGGGGGIADFPGRNLAVSGSFHVIGNHQCVRTGDLADGKQNLYRRTTLHGADQKKEAASCKDRSGKLCR